MNRNAYNEYLRERLAAANARLRELMALSSSKLSSGRPGSGAIEKNAPVIDEQPPLTNWEMFFRLAADPRVELDRASLVYEGSRLFYAQLYALHGKERGKWSSIIEAAEDKAKELNAEPAIQAELKITPLTLGDRFDASLCEIRDSGEKLPLDREGLPQVLPSTFVVFTQRKSESGDGVENVRKLRAMVERVPTASDQE